MRWSRSLVLFLAAAGCGVAHSTLDTEDLAVPDDIAPSADFEHAPVPSPRLRDDAPADLAARIDSHFEGRGSRRLHVQLDRPLYKPGETVWVKTWSVATRRLARNAQHQITYELVNPRGQVVETKRVRQQGGTATNDFVLDDDAPGGKWTLRATLPTAEVDERPFVVSNYQAPRIRKKLEFVREAYGAGDRVEALLELERGAGGALAEHEVRALLQVGGQTVLEQRLTTDETGAALVSAVLPDDLASSDGLLTVLVDDGGVTESISRSVPIVLADLTLAFFPEGGDLVQGLPGRMYFEATNQHGEPADVTGYVTDDRGRRVADFRSEHDGLGRFALDPEPGRVYIAHVTAPVGVIDGFVLPAAKKKGCTLRSFDDVASERPEVRVAVRCTTGRDVIVTGVLRETPIDAAAVTAGPDEDAVVYLRPDDELADQQGAVRVTVFDRKHAPLAERLVYRNRGRDLSIELTPDRERYGPRDEVVLDVRTTDPSGDAVAAELALAVVDDAVISLADDQEGHMLTRLYLEPELVDSPKDPGWYFDADEPLGARGLDLVMGTRGWRRFEWKQLFAPRAEVTAAVSRTAEWEDDMVLEDLDGMAEVGWDELDFAEAAEPEPEPDAVAMPMAQPVPKDAKKKVAIKPAAPEPARDAELGALEHPAPRRRDRARGGEDLADEIAPIAGAVALEWWPVEEEEQLQALGYVEDREIAFHRGNRQQAWAPVRVFPRPDYRRGFTGIRTDFRDTVHWEPTLTTGADGRGQVRFYLSDAVTTFRVTAEGLGGSFAGHQEATLTSVLPVSVATKLPSAVSTGDKLVLPVTVTNTRERPLRVAVSSAIDSEIVSLDQARGALTVDPGASETHWVEVDVGTGNETATVFLEAEGGGLIDRVEQPLNIVPAGFPRSWSAAGESDDEASFAFQLDDVVPGSLTASVTWHPSSVSTLISGMEGLIRSPGGCFEQTSSTNWPNVAILSYLDAHDGDPRLRVKSSKALDIGYAKLTGYQVAGGGFETWGTGPGKEALSAFGLLQFADMKKVYPVTDSILSRDADYLLAQRDGRGGFKNSGESAHGYGSAPAAVLDGFITYALATTGHQDALSTELDHQARVARRSEDPYVLALAARSLLVADRDEGALATERLATLQADDGSFPGAESSITRSYEANLLVESTALAALALMEDGRFRSAADRAASWLIDNRQGAGTWGATQATALALGALTRHAEVNRAPRADGELFVEVNGRMVGTLAYSADQSEPLVIDGWDRALRSGVNHVVLRQDSGEPLPYTVEVAWTSIDPDSSPGAELSLQTTLDKTRVAMGDTVRLTATIDNLEGRIVPSPIARIGLPAGLEPQLWQLKQLQERGEIALFETRPREVTLYWDGIHEGGEHEVDLDLVAAVPGTFTGPASSAYPYYNDDEKAWDSGLEIRIDRP